MTFIKIGAIYLFLAAVVFAPLSLHAEETQSEKAYKIEIKDNLISLDAQDAEIADILKEIEKSTEIKTVIEESLIGKKVTKNFWTKAFTIMATEGL